MPASGRTESLGMAEELAKVARALAGRQPATSGARGTARRPADELWQHLRGSRERGTLMGVAAWLWKTGVRDPEAVMFLLERGVARGVRNWFSYYARGGVARTAALQAYSRARAREGTTNG